MAERPALPHIPQAELVSRALDGGRAPWDAAAARHLTLCRTCRERLAVYERAAAAGRLTRPGENLQTPPARVWAELRAHLAAADRFPTPSPPPAPTAHPVRRAVVRALRCASAAARAVVRCLVRLLARLRPGRRPEANR
ncbi:hypothetical protein KMT30_28790 [Streptomyces sp. IBSBF 2953]|uniref:hypothetical protein n=1 Tax=Streptomyces TaxID=1883 RepID=UPI00211AA2FB|nr:hypothetical protein [Streptomyces scabiei]MCQ9182970.1 hypothetical protein [Streptomyces hayashii]MDX3115495.1 hypothetical protein [Streptomyces scabiei]